MSQTEKTFTKGQESAQQIGEILTERRTELDKMRLEPETENNLTSELYKLYNDHIAKINNLTKRFNTAYSNYKVPGKISGKENQSFKEENNSAFQGEVSLLEKECLEIIQSFKDETAEIISNATASASSEN